MSSTFFNSGRLGLSQVTTHLRQSPKQKTITHNTGEKYLKLILTTSTLEKI